MQVVLLNGSTSDDTTAQMICDAITSQLDTPNDAVTQVNLWEKEITNCTGCFGCWVRTPGECVHNDAGRDITKLVIASDLVITISPITFGGHSYHLKKALDRLIPLISPFFMKIRGEVHHKPRYRRYPKSIGIGILPEANQEAAHIYRDLIARNAINLHNPVALASVFLASQSAEEIGREIEKLLKEVGA